MWIPRVIETNRGVFELFEKGEGEPLAITHLYSEFNERGNTFANPFTTSYRVLLINLRGTGGSVKAEREDQYSMNETVKDLEAIRQALGYEKWGFAGHSTGGMLGLKYAINASDSLTKMIAGGAAASVEYGADPTSIYCPEHPKFQRIIEIMDLLNDPTTSTEVRQTISYEWAVMSYYCEENLKKSLMKPNSGKTVGKRLEYFRKVECENYDVRVALKQVMVPSFIYCGIHDAQCPYRFSLEISELIPNATLTTFENSNHNPFSEEEDKFQTFVESTL